METVALLIVQIGWHQFHIPILQMPVVYFSILALKPNQLSFIVSIKNWLLKLLTTKSTVAQLDLMALKLLSILVLFNVLLEPNFPNKMQLI